MSLHVFDEYEEKLQCHKEKFIEVWIVYAEPAKAEDPRVPRRQANFQKNNKETVYVAVPLRNNKVQARAEFNACGESSTTATSYTAVPVRPFNELPRMSVAVKSSILGVAAAGAVRSKRLPRSCDLQGAPFSMTEVRPMNLVTRLFIYLSVTRVVDYCAGAAAGVQE